MTAKRRRKRQKKYEERRKAKRASAGGQRTKVQSGTQPVQAAELPFHSSTRRLRQATLLAAQRLYGNGYVQRILERAPFVGTLQRQEEDGSENAANPGGRGPGQIQNGSEQFYTVAGATLDAITDQLAHFDGFAAQTRADLGMEGNVTPQRQDDGTLQVQVTWVIPEVTVQLPRWEGYDAACAAAQREWDRFMQQTRQHEQTAHVDAAHDFVQELGEEDTVITGATVAELQRNLQAKRDELGGRLQAIHDSCDHGASIDAILHPDNGRCPE